jgi:formate hydrogenlyase transcriptional activator
VILSRGSSLDAPLTELKPREFEDADEEVKAPRATATLEEAEREHILRALRETNWMVGGKAGAATRLGMKRTTLQSKMEKLGIEKP